MSNRIPSKNYYEILQIPQTASATAISAAYKKLAFQYHPDRNRSPESTWIMQEINEAYETLRHPQKRAIYDAKLLAKGKATLVVYRGGAPVGIARKLRILVDGAGVGSIAWGQGQTFMIEPGRHTLAVQLDAGTSAVVRFSCEAGDRLEFECGAGSILGSLFSPRSYYIRQR